MPEEQPLPPDLPPPPIADEIAWRHLYASMIPVPPNPVRHDYLGLNHALKYYESSDLPRPVVATHVAHLRDLYWRGILNRLSNHPPVWITQAFVEEVDALRQSDLPPDVIAARDASLRALFDEGIYRQPPVERLRDDAARLLGRNVRDKAVLGELLAWLPSYEVKGGYRVDVRQVEEDIPRLLNNRGLRLGSDRRQQVVAASQLRSWLGGLYAEGLYRPTHRNYESGVMHFLGSHVGRLEELRLPADEVLARLKVILRRILEDDWT